MGKEMAWRLLNMLSVALAKNRTPYSPPEIREKVEYEFSINLIGQGQT
jgi:hypothetical protein